MARKDVKGATSPAAQADPAAKPGGTAAAARGGPDHDREALGRCLEAIAAGDQDALRDLVVATQARLRAIAYRLLGDASETDEVVQDVYLTVWDKAARYEAGRAHAMAWLTVITRNRSLDRLRQRTVRRSLLARSAEFLPPAADEGTDLERNEIIERMHAKLDELEPDIQRIIKAAFFDGHTYEALARAHDVPLGTMKSRIRRALLSLRSALHS